MAVSANMLEKAKRDWQELVSLDSALTCLQMALCSWRGVSSCWKELYALHVAGERGGKMYKRQLYNFTGQFD